MPPKAHAALKQLIEDFRNAGHVPFKDKDKVYKAYRAAIDKQFDALNIDASNRRLETFRSNLEDMTTQGEQKLHRERDKMVRAYEHLKAEIATYENNMGFPLGKLQERQQHIEGNGTQNRRAERGMPPAGTENQPDRRQALNSPCTPDGRPAGANTRRNRMIKKNQTVGQHRDGMHRDGRRVRIFHQSLQHRAGRRVWGEHRAAQPLPLRAGGHVRLLLRHSPCSSCPWCCSVPSWACAPSWPPCSRRSS